MKMLNKILALSVFVLPLGACNDFLDRFPYDKVSSETAFASATLAEAAVVGAYANLKYDYVNQERGYLNWDAFASVIDPAGSLVYLNYAYLTGTIQPNDDSFLTYWKRLYEGVTRANDVIANIQRVPDMSDKLKAQRVAECKFLRAYHYYRLNSLWRGVPVYMENLAPSEYTRARSSEQQVWQIIVDDCTACIECEALPDKYTAKSSDFGRITKGAAYTLRGKAYMWLQEWGKAAQDFMKVGELGYELYKGQYADLFTLANERCNEMIFSVPMEEIAGCGNVFSYTYGNFMTTGYGNSSFAMNTNFVNSYQWADGKPFDWDDVIDGYNAMTPKARSVFFLRDNITATERATMQSESAAMDLYLTTGNEARILKAYTDRDPRLAATVITPYATYTGGASGENINYVSRWPFRSETKAPYDLKTRQTNYMLYPIRKFVAVGRECVHVSYNPVDVPIFRYADVLLSLAEALNEQGNYAEAIKYVNKVRERAGVAPLNQKDNSYVAVTSADDLRPRIRDEKKWELACEEQLYYEELRWGTWQQDKFAAGNGLQEVWGAPVYEYAWGGKAYLKWPIPSSEREKNPNLEQNDYWL